MPLNFDLLNKNSRRIFATKISTIPLSFAHKLKNGDAQNAKEKCKKSKPKTHQTGRMLGFKLKPKRKQMPF